MTLQGTYISLSLTFYCTFSFIFCYNAAYVEEGRQHSRSCSALFFQITVLIEILIPLVLFLVLMSIRFRREPDFVPEGMTKHNLLNNFTAGTFSLYFASEA